MQMLSLDENQSPAGQVILLKEAILMASSKGYLDFILEQLSYLDDISYRAMMSE